MSNAKRCDRCGKYYEPKITTGPGYSIYHYSIPLNTFGADVESFDLCPECAHQFTDWAENPDSVILDANKFDRINAISPEETEKALKQAKIERKLKLLQLLKKSKLIRRQ